MGAPRAPRSSTSSWRRAWYREALTNGRGSNTGLKIIGAASIPCYRYILRHRDMWKHVILWGKVTSLAYPQDIFARAFSRSSLPFPTKSQSTQLTGRCISLLKGFIFHGKKPKKETKGLDLVGEENHSTSGGLKVSERDFCLPGEVLIKMPFPLSWRIALMV